MNNTFINNTFSSTSSTLVFVNNSARNTFYWNNFSRTSGLYVNDTDGTSLYNLSEGNLWQNVLNGSVVMYGSVPSQYGAGLYISTVGIPYNNSTSQGKFLCGFEGCGDYAPLSYPRYANLSINASPQDYGNYTGNGTYVVPTTVNITATPNVTKLFSNWTSEGNCSIANTTSNETNVSLYSNCNVTANFINYTVTEDCRGISRDTDLLGDTYATAGGICYSFEASDIYLDCHGYSIYGVNASESIGINVDNNNVVIRNCNIYNMSIGIFNNRGFYQTYQDNGIYSEEGKAGINTGGGSLVITGNEIILGTGAGINFQDNVLTFVIANNTIISTLDNAKPRLYMQSGAGDGVITGNIFDTYEHDDDAISGDSSTLLDIVNNTINGRINFITTTYTNINENNISTGAVDFALFLVDSSDMHFYNNNVSSNGSYVYNSGADLKFCNGDGNVWAPVMNGTWDVKGNDLSTHFPGLYYGSGGDDYPLSEQTTGGAFNGTMKDSCAITPFLGEPGTFIWIYNGSSWVEYNESSKINFRCSNPFPSYCQPQNQDNETSKPIFRNQNNGTVIRDWQAIKTNVTWETANLTCGTSRSPTSNINLTMEYKNYSLTPISSGLNESLYCWFYIESVPAGFARDFAIDFTGG